MSADSSRRRRRQRRRKGKALLGEEGDTGGGVREQGGGGGDLEKDGAAEASLVQGSGLLSPVESAVGDRRSDGPGDGLLGVEQRDAGGLEGQGGLGRQGGVAGVAVGHDVARIKAKGEGRGGEQGREGA